MKKNKRVIFALDDDLLKALQERAKAERRTVSDYIRIILEDETSKKTK